MQLDFPLFEENCLKDLEILFEMQGKTETLQIV